MEKVKLTMFKHIERSPEENNALISSKQRSFLKNAINCKISEIKKP